jgi:uncharacterized protein (TIGR03083 family)
MEPADYLAHLRADGDALAAAAGRAPSAPVPTCPEWDMTDLVGHVGGVHHWVEHIVATGAQEYIKRDSPVPDARDAVLDWYRSGLGELLTTLEAAGPETMVWNWRDRGPAPAAFWYRRMAHETAIHRWDGQHAAGQPQPLSTDLAGDGIDEYLSFVSGWLARRPIEGLKGSLHLHATDSPGEWSLYLSSDGLEHRREHAKADAAVRGPMSDLMLWLVNRIPPDAPSLQLFGDADLVTRWSQLQF